ncbi:MAG: L,D-transpeptidase family protein [Syntrophaceae bacterium]
MITRRSYLLAAVCFFALILMLITVRGHAIGLSNLIVTKIQDRLKVHETAQPVICRGTLPCNSPFLPQFYTKRNFQPCWSNEGALLPNAESMITIIRDAKSHGLQPDDYHLGEIEAAVAELRQDMKRSETADADKIVNIEFLLSDAFLLYGSHILSGRVDPNKIYKTWIANQRNANLADILQDAVASNRIKETLQSLEPQHEGYKILRQTLASYRVTAAKGGWPTIPGGNKVNLRKGQRSKMVPLLWTRLMMSNDLDVTKGDNGDLFDDAMKEAVLNFQRRHGLTADGVVRQETVKALNVPIEKRIRQIELNLERWRWLQNDLGKRYILVNVPDYSLKIVNENHVDMDMRVIVGKRVRNKKVDMHTPIFTGRMTHLEINPYWNVPYSIATKEFLPELKKDPLYLSRKNMQLLAGRGAIDPTTVDWTKIHEKNFRYQIRQNPGAFNALSRIKFLFPNRFDVYLHDTPTRGLFKRTQRAFSHGCMRVEKPIEMATYLLRDNNGWSREKILAAIKRGKNLPVYLTEPIDVHVQYWTAWADGDGTVNFRDDLYSYDPILERALVEKPAVPLYVPDTKNATPPVMTQNPEPTAHR